ncbi:D-2-hydroxyacid dehydrogenase [Clostridium ljungdahlii]|uniref:Putative 2-hydroxyacid dehydrogenase n=1 Tax=Clostridium ljungdahlii TaxID=1538 RepID=A0A166S904_9CLOT|nr:D-2-hydroxyacid dehydrogenase [Clostridium ljungdahlii]OAA91828.1 putative 2-hydroxyacid dehydrogenase [Clostridium ljungdahlii]
MKIVVLDGYTLNPGDISWEPLEKLGDLNVYDRTSHDNDNNDLILERIKDAEIVFTNDITLSRDVLEKSPKLQYVGILATGYNMVDVNAAKELGITVTNIPTYGTSSVSQMAVALLLELCHHVWAHSEAVKNGEWASNGDWCFWKYPLIELANKTAGIIGYGRIGQSTGKILQAFGMKVLAYDKHENKNLENDSMKYAKLNELFQESDVVFLHCPLFDSNRGIINKDSISKMKDGVIIINNARGPLIVEKDLAEALNSGKISGAALDVVSIEPIEESNPLLKAKNCIITPHISWAPRESRQRLMDIAAENLERFLEGSPVNVVSR